MARSETLLLTGKDVTELLSLGDCIQAVEQAFRMHGEGRAPAPGVLGMPAQGGGFHIKAGSMALSRNYFAAKANANFPSNPARGLPTIQGVIFLFDAENGQVLPRAATRSRRKPRLHPPKKSPPFHTTAEATIRLSVLKPPRSLRFCCHDRHRCGGHRRGT
jgi:hypothetical protein